MMWFVKSIFFGQPLLFTRVTNLKHPPYSPALERAEFYLFPRLKMKLKGHHFVDSNEVIENATKLLKEFLDSYANARRSM